MAYNFQMERDIVFIHTFDPSARTCRLICLLCSPNYHFGLAWFGDLDLLRRTCGNYRLFGHAYDPSLQGEDGKE